MSKGYAAYKSAVQATESDRTREYRAIGLITAKLERALPIIASPDVRDVAQVQDALHHNIELWTLLRMACIDPSNKLPQELCASLINIARFMQSSTDQLNAADVPDGAVLEAMIEINKNVMAGLSPVPNS